MMRYRPLPAATILLSLAALGASLYGRGDEPARDPIPAFRAIPEDALVVLGTAGLPRLRAAWESSPWSALWNDPEVQAWLAPLRDEVEETMDSVRQESGISLGDLWTALEGGGAVALLDFDGAEERFALGLALESGAQKAQLEKIVEAFVERGAREEGLVRSREDYRDVSVEVVRPTPDSGGTDQFRYAFVGSTLVAVAANYEEEELEDMVDRLEGRAEGKSFAESDRWRASLAKTSVGLFAGAFDVGRFVARLADAGMPSPASLAMEVIGVGPETRLAMSFDLGKEGSRLAIHLGGAKTGLLSLAQMPTDGFRTLRLMPKGVPGASAFRLGPKRVWDEVVRVLEDVLPDEKAEEFQGGIRAFEERLGFTIAGDLLACFGDEVGMYSVEGDPDEMEWQDEESFSMAGMSRTGFLLALRRPEKIEGYLEGILRAVGLGTTLKTEEYLGRKLHTFMFFTMPFSYAVAGEALALSPSAERVQEALRLASNPDLPSMEADERFKRVAEALPRVRSGISFSATDESIEQAVAMLGMFQNLFETGMTPGGGNRLPVSLAKQLVRGVPAADVFKRHLKRDSGTALVPDGDGVLYLLVGP